MKAYKIETGYVLDMDVPKKLVIKEASTSLEDFDTTGMKSITIESDMFSFVENTKKADPSDLTLMAYALVQYLVGQFIFGEE